MNNHLVKGTETLKDKIMGTWILVQGLYGACGPHHRYHVSSVHESWSFCYAIEQAYIIMFLDLTSPHGGLHNVSELLFSHLISFR